MSSSDQGLKTKQEMLDEYEKGYLVRVEGKQESEEKPTEESKVETHIPLDLQSLIFEIAGEFETNANKDYIGHCVVCVKKVERNKMVYKNDHLFHSNCFKQHGNEYEATTDLLRDERRAKMDLVYLKNLKLRMSNQGTRKNPGSTPKKRSVKKKSSKQKAAKRRTKRKDSAKKRKPRRVRRKIAKKRSRSKSRKRRR